MAEGEGVRTTWLIPNCSCSIHHWRCPGEIKINVLQMRKKRKVIDAPSLSHKAGCRPEIGDRQTDSRLQTEDCRQETVEG